MDQRVRKTKQRIYDALCACLQEQAYGDIRIGDILSKAEVSRSTFYAHFTSVDDVLSSIGKDIFSHVFSHALEHEKTHDFSKSSILDYSHLFTHIFYHLYEEKDLISKILSSEGKEIFLRDFRSKVNPVANKALESHLLPLKDVPTDLRVEQIIESFILIMTYWFRHGCMETPEKLTSYFFSMNQ